MSANEALLDIARIQREFVGQRIGRRIEYYQSTSSTNDVAWRAIERGDPDHNPDHNPDHDADGLVVLAEHQSSGRGRLGRGWEMPNAAGVLASVVVCDKTAKEKVTALGLVAAVTVCDALSGSASVVATIKWPNDVLVGGRKIAGILVETRVLASGERASVIGIGINCLQHRGHFAGDLAVSATSLEMESDEPVDRTMVVMRLLRELNTWFGEPAGLTQETLREAWRSRSAMLGQPIRVRHDGVIYSGSVIDIDPTSDLVIKLDEGGVRAFSAADTTVVRVDADSR